MSGNLWQGMDVRKLQRRDKDGVFRGVYVLFINEKEHSTHDSLTNAEREYLKTKGFDPNRYRGR